MSFQKTILKEVGEVVGEFSVEILLVVKSVTDLEEVVDEFKQVVEMSGMSILNESAISVNNVGGYDILTGASSWKMRQATFFSDGLAYFFTFSSQDEFYSTYEETFNSVVNSFSIDPNSQ